MPIDHFGLGVPDIDVARSYYDELMPMLGFQSCFGNGYCPVDGSGAQLFLYEVTDHEGYSRTGPGLQHIAFEVSTRVMVDVIHGWVRARGDEILQSGARPRHEQRRCALMARPASRLRRPQAGRPRSAKSIARPAAA